MRIQLFDYSVNILESILWQYNEAENLLSLLNQKQSWYDTNQTEFWERWYTEIFNLPGTDFSFFGAAVWSIILGVPLLVPLNPDPNDKPVWGFNAFNPTFPDLLNTYTNFNNGNFSNRNSSPVELTLAQQQFLLRLRYFDLTTRGDITDINLFLFYLCATSDIGYSGTIYALDGFDMTMTYVFTAPFPENLLIAIRQSGLDILPRPATVGEKIYTASDFTWGFNAYDPAFPDLINNNKNFENGNFFSGVS